MVPREPSDTQLPHFYCGWGYLLGPQGCSLLIAGGQRVDTRIVEKSTVAVSPGVGLGANTEVVVGDELGAFVMARVEPGV